MFAPEGAEWVMMAPSYDTEDWVEKTSEIYKTTSGPTILTANKLMKMLETLMVIGEFDGKNYLKLNDEDVKMADTLCRLWYIRIDDRGHISTTERGRGIIDGSIKTSHETPAFLAGYMSRSGGCPKCGTAESQS